jgi:hypothetical protein
MNAANWERPYLPCLLLHRPLHLSPYVLSILRIFLRCRSRVDHDFEGIRTARTVRDAGAMQAAPHQPDEGLHFRGGAVLDCGVGAKEGLEGFGQELAEGDLLYKNEVGFGKGPC